MSILLCNMLSAFLGIAIVLIPGYLLVSHWERQAIKEREKQQQGFDFDDLDENTERFYHN